MPDKRRRVLRNSLAQSDRQRSRFQLYAFITTATCRKTNHTPITDGSLPLPHGGVTIPEAQCVDLVLTLHVRHADLQSAEA
jgi:hypothetical protein